MGKFIWQHKNWPQFQWDSDRLLNLLGQARQKQGRLLAQARFFDLEEKAQFLVEEAVKTSAIEGEIIDKDSVRSSVAKRLGLPQKGYLKQQRHVEGLVEMLMDANANYTKALNKKRLFSWHAALFPTGYSGLTKIKVAGWRENLEPIQVVSGSLGKEVVHYGAPPSKQTEQEIQNFLKWWNNPPKEFDGLIRAAIAHLWFVTVHPFEDGNGRITRAITDMALAQDEKSEMRLYSLSSQIESEKEEYYNILEDTQKGNLDITQWINWFLSIYIRSIDKSFITIKKVLFISKFWQETQQSEFNKRQIKVLQKMLEAEPDGFEGGMTNKKYVNITKTSRETAKRDLADLEKRGIINRKGGKGRSVSYVLSLKM